MRVASGWRVGALGCGLVVGLLLGGCGEGGTRSRAPSRATPSAAATLGLSSSSSSPSGGTATAPLAAAPAATTATASRGSSSGRAAASTSRAASTTAATTAGTAATASTAAPPRAGTQAAPAFAWALRHGMDAARYQQEVDRLAALGLRPLAVHVHGSAAQPVFTAIWIGDGKPWAARHGLSAEQFQHEVDRLAQHGYRLQTVSMAGLWPNERYTATWVRDGKSWQARHRMRSADYQQEVERLAQQGYRPVWVSATGPLGSQRFAAVWVRDGRRWAAVHDRSWRNLREEIDRKARADLRLISLTEYSTPGARRYAAIWEGAPAQAGDNLVFVKVDEATFQAVADRLAAAGLRPACAVRLGTRNHPRYACAWRLEESPPLWRASGPPVAELSSLDEVMRRYMSERRVTAAQLAVMRRGELVFSRAYTWGPASLRPTTTASRLRIASISKPITALAILRLVDQGRLSLSSPLAAVLPAAVAPLDPRIRRITIEDLLWHRGGWQIDDQRDAQGRLVRRGLGFDPMFQDRVVAALLRAGRLPIESEDVITFMFRLQRLQFDPGTAQSYSNFGFNVLGRVIEELTGQDYESYVREQILLPLGLRSFRIGRAPLAEQLPGEVLYLDARDAVSRDVHGSDALVPNQYGGWNLANMDSHGGWVCSAEELVRLAGAVLRGQVLSPASTAWYTMQRNYPTHNGSLPGTWTWLRVRGDVIYAVLTNQRAISRRADPGGRYAWSRTGQELSQRLDAAIDAIANWP